MTPSSCAIRDIAQLVKDFQDQSRSYMQRAARHRKKSGEEIHVEIVSFNLESTQARAPGRGHDVTGRLKMEGQARELEQKYRPARVPRGKERS